MPLGLTDCDHWTRRGVKVFESADAASLVPQALRSARHETDASAETASTLETTGKIFGSQLQASLTCRRVGWASKAG